MGLFTGKEKQQIETLHALLADAEAELEEKEQAAEQNATVLANQLGEARKAAKAQQDAVAIERASLEQAHAATLEALTRTHELALAAANGHLEEARLKGDRWDALMFGHKLAVAGRKDVHGESLIEYRCQCSFSVFAPEGFFKIEEPG